MDRPTPWLPVALIMFGLTVTSFFLGTRPGQQGWMALTWFALSVAVFCLAAWADERWPGSAPSTTRRHQAELTAHCRISGDLHGTQ